MIPKFLKNENMVKGVTLITIFLTLWWISIHPFSQDSNLIHRKYIWGAFYQLIALWGGVSGLRIANVFGGIKSIFGKSVSFFSYGLLLQCFGQSVYSYYNLFSQIQAPYPSLGDVGYFGSVICYIIAVIYLGKAVGVKISLKSSINKIQTIIIPLSMLSVSYFIFLKDYVVDYSRILKLILDFGYPLGQAFYVSIAILTLSLSRIKLGGFMKKPILFLLISLIVQYLSDFNFLYNANQNTWYVGGLGDFFYMVSYLLMTISIMQIGFSLNKIRRS